MVHAHIVQVPGALCVTSLDALERDLARAASVAAADGLPVVIEGGQTFCSGLDLSRTGAGNDPEPGIAAFVRVLHRLRTLPVGVVAVVQGNCLAGGLGLAAACDVVIAADTARFGLPEALFGLVPEIVRPLLAERMLPQRLRLLALRGGSVSAAEAARLGLVDIVVPAAELRLRLGRELRQLRRARSAATERLKYAPALLAELRAGAALTTERLRDPVVARAVRAFHSGGAPWEAA